ENPHQLAALYGWGCDSGLSDDNAPSTNGARQSETPSTPTVAGAHLLHGKELSFNNLLDLDAALATVASFKAAAAVVIKHTNPCGLACGDSPVESYRRAHSGDPVAAYGGILGFNREIDEATAREVGEIFYEAIIAPSYSPAALALLQRRKNVRL